MPHLTLEYSDNVPSFDAHSVLLELNQALVASGQFEEIDIKSRAVRHDTYVVGTAPDNRGFVHVTLAILSGRSPQTKRALSEGVLHALKQVWAPAANVHIQLCVEVRDMEREPYAKASIVG